MLSLTEAVVVAKAVACQLMRFSEILKRIKVESEKLLLHVLRLRRTRASASRFLRLQARTAEERDLILKGFLRRGTRDSDRALIATGCYGSQWLAARIRSADGVRSIRTQERR